MLFRDFYVIEADEPAHSMFQHPNSQCFVPYEKKKKKLNTQFIFFVYKEFLPVLLSGLKIENAFKMRKWVCRTFVYLLAQPRNDAHAFFTKSRSDIRSREQRLGESLRLRSGSRTIGKNSLFTLKKKPDYCMLATYQDKKKQGIQSVFFSHIKRPIEILGTVITGLSCLTYADLTGY
jgi:hypothetical protein